MAFSALDHEILHITSSFGVAWKPELFISIFNEYAGCPSTNKSSNSPGSEGQPLNSIAKAKSTDTFRLPLHRKSIFSDAANCVAPDKPILSKANPVEETNFRFSGHFTDLNASLSKQ